MGAFEGVNKEAAQAALGITAVGTASTTTTGAVSGLGAALKGMFAASPLTAFMAIVSVASVVATVVGSLVNIWDDVKQAQIDAAKEAGNAFAESSGSIQSQIHIKQIEFTTESNH